MGDVGNNSIWCPTGALSHAWKWGLKGVFRGILCLDGRKIPTLLHLMDGVTGSVYKAEGGIIPSIAKSVQKSTAFLAGRF